MARAYRTLRPSGHRDAGVIRSRVESTDLGCEDLGHEPLHRADIPSLPRRIQIIEVGPRDGFQMETTFIPTELKVATLNRLSASGVSEIEATSFVHPRVIPQMADASEVMARIDRNANVRYLALVPNRRGAERALAAGVDGLRLVVCATETYNQRNVGLRLSRACAISSKSCGWAKPKAWKCRRSWPRRSDVRSKARSTMIG